MITPQTIMLRWTRSVPDMVSPTAHTRAAGYLHPEVERFLGGEPDNRCHLESDTYIDRIHDGPCPQ